MVGTQTHPRAGGVNRGTQAWVGSLSAGLRPAYHRGMESIRRATVADVPAMATLINDAAEFGLMLPKSLASLYENVREFVVAVDDEREQPREHVAGGGSGQDGPLDPAHAPGVVGVCGLSVVWANLAEVVSLVVAPSHRGRGLGKRLTRACLDEAAALGIRRVMTLTYERQFFEAMGFAVVDRAKLPLKVWSECVRCPKNQACDEIAMLREIEGVPELSAPRPQAPPRDAYVVPVTLSATRGGTPGG